MIVTNESGSRQDDMGRISLEFKVVNNQDLILAKRGGLAADEVRSQMIDGIIDTGAAQLVLPESLATTLGLEDEGTATVRYADQRTAVRRTVTDVRLFLLGRTGVFSAIVEPSRSNALIGAIVLEALDLIVDCATQKVHPRDPDRIVAEIE